MDEFKRIAHINKILPDHFFAESLWNLTEDFIPNPGSKEVIRVRFDKQDNFEKVLHKCFSIIAHSIIMKWF